MLLLSRRLVLLALEVEQFNQIWRYENLTKKKTSSFEELNSSIVTQHAVVSYALHYDVKNLTYLKPF